VKIEKVGVSVSIDVTKSFEIGAIAQSVIIRELVHHPDKSGQVDAPSNTVLFHPKHNLIVF